MERRIPVAAAVLLTGMTCATLFAQQVDSTPAPDTALASDTSVALDEIVLTAKQPAPAPGSAGTGYRHTEAQLGPLGGVPLKDIPFTVNVTSGQSIENRGVHALADALKTNPTTAAVQQPSTDGRGQSEVSIRGFDPYYLQDGLLMRSNLPVPVEDLDRIEVVNGLTGFLNGFGNPGGTMNFVTKQPVSDPKLDLAIGQYNGGVNFVHGDLGGPLNKGKQLSYRFNAYLEDGNTFIDDATQRRSRISCAVGLRILDNTTIRANISHQDIRLEGQQAAFIVDPARGVKVPSASKFDPSTLYGQPWTYVKGRQDMFGAGVESRLGKVFAMRGAYNYTSVWRKNNGVSDSLLDNAGNYRSTYSDGAPQDVDEHSAYVLADAKFSTWKVQHAVTAGWTHDSYIQKNNPVSLSRIPLDTFSIARPGYIAMPDTLAPTAKVQRTQPVYNSLVLSDLFTWRMVSLLVGANYAFYNYKNENLDTGLIRHYKQSRLTPTVALTVKPWAFLSVYGSYVQGLVPGGYTTKASARNVNEELPPSVNDQYEVGVKATIMERLDVTAAGFRINKVNEYLDPADSYYKQDGREVHQGLEGIVTGKVFDWLTLGGGGTLMDAHIEKAADKSIKDKTPANVPEKQARAFVELKVPALKGLSASGGVNYNGYRWVDARNTAVIPDTWVFDAGIRYRADIRSHGLSVNLNIDNLLNNTYWAAYKPAGTVGLCLGAPRTVSLSAKFEL
jgi:iron complex outermembrane recepter protein